MRYFKVHAGLALVLALVVASCHHGDAEVRREETPLPPASGTPVGYLLDAKDSLALRDDQVARLQAIDDELAADLARSDASARAANSQRAAASQAAPSSGGRHHGRSGAMRHRGGGASAPQPDPDNVPAPAAGDTSAEVRNALERALDVLDPDQQQAARKLLSDHDIDLEGQPAPTSAGSDAE